MKKSLYLQADPNLTYTVQTQLKEQLKWLIGTGRIKPGEMLPAAQELADSLRVNRNTVNLVYTQLRDEGIVSMQKGKGTQVLHHPSVDALIQQREPMQELLDQLMTEARQLQLDLRELTIASLAYVQMLEEGKSSRKIVFIECREHDYVFYRHEIEKYTHGAEIITWFLEELQESPEQYAGELAHADVVVTTLNHATEVQALIGNKKPIITIGATVDLRSLMEIANFAPGTKVGFVCLGKRGGEWMVDRAQDAGVSHVELLSAGFHEDGQLQQVIQDSVAIYASGAVYEDLKELNPDKEVRQLPFILERSSENLLRELAIKHS